LAWGAVDLAGKLLERGFEELDTEDSGNLARLALEHVEAKLRTKPDEIT